MKTVLTALTLFALTATAVVFYPESRGAAPAPIRTVDPPPALAAVEAPRIDVVFALDTTGSMGGLIQGAKQKIWSIASAMAQAQPTPVIRMGLVAYRDRGDAYVTKVIDLSEDLDSVYAALMDFEAGGGGDGPESVNAALHDAVHRMQWTPGEDTYKVIFLVGDAPPHMDYPDEVHYPVTLAAAAEKGIVVNAIQCGGHAATLRVWQQIAQAGQGHYFQVEQSGGAVAMATPFDERLARLSADLDRTRVYFGSAEQRAARKAKMAAAEKVHAAAPATARADRAAFNASEGGYRNLLGDDELVDAVTSGRVELDELEAGALPEPLRKLEPEEQAAFVAEQARKRETLRQEIEALSEERESYLRDHRSVGHAEAFDAKVTAAVREQAAAKGLRYDDEE